MLAQALKVAVIATTGTARHAVQYVLKTGACAQPVFVLRTAQGAAGRGMRAVTIALRRAVRVLYKLGRDSADVESAEADKRWRRVHHPARMSGLGFVDPVEVGAAAYLGMLAQCAPQLKKVIPAAVAAQGLGCHIKEAWQRAADALRAQVERHDDVLGKVDEYIATRLDHGALLNGAAAAGWQGKLTDLVHAARHLDILDALPMAMPGMAHDGQLEADILRAQFLEGVEDPEERNSGAGFAVVSPLIGGLNDAAIIWNGQFRSGFGHSGPEAPIYCNWCGHPINPLIYMHHAICPDRGRNLQCGRASYQSRHKRHKIMWKNLVLATGGSVLRGEPLLRSLLDGFRVRDSYRSAATKSHGPASDDAKGDLLFSYKVCKRGAGGAPQIRTESLIIYVMVVDAYLSRKGRQGPARASAHGNYVPGAAAEDGEATKRGDYNAKYEGVDYSKLALVAMDTSCHFSTGCIKALRWLATAASNADQRIAAWSNGYPAVYAKVKQLLALQIQADNALFFREHTSSAPPLCNSRERVSSELQRSGQSSGPTLTGKRQKDRLWYSDSQHGEGGGVVASGGQESDEVEVGVNTDEELEALVAELEKEEIERDGLGHALEGF